MDRQSKDPFGPLETAVRVARNLVLVGVGLLLVGRLVGLQTTFGEWGNLHHCVSAPQVGLSIGGTAGADPVGNLRPGVHVGVPSEFRLCTDRMSFADQTWFTLPSLLQLLWFAGFVWLTLRLIRGARRDGTFTAAVARATSRLGTYLLVGSVAMSLLGALCRSIGISHLVTEYSVIGATIANPGLDWPVIMTGCGVITVGRIMAQAVPMREELEATV